MPSSDDYRLRPAARGDARAITDLLVESDIDAYGSPASDENEVVDDWAFPGFEMEKDSFVAVAPDGSLAGYAAVFKKKPGRVLEAYGSVRPSERKKGVGRALYESVERRGRTYLDEVGAERVTVQQHAFGNDAAAHELLAGMGYSAIRHMWLMTIDVGRQLGSPPSPPGIDIRPFATGDERRIYEVMEEGFKDHWQHEPRPYDEWTKRVLGRETFVPELSYLAMDGDDAVGGLVSSVMVGEGFVDHLAVVRPWRGRGIAAALLETAFAGFARKGYSKVSLYVDAENPTGATRVYERAGMRVERSFDIFAKELVAGS